MNLLRTPRDSPNVRSTVNFATIMRWKLRPCFHNYRYAVSGTGKQMK